jgi:hypothetical protein
MNACQRNQPKVKDVASFHSCFQYFSVGIKNIPLGGDVFVRWRGLEPPRLTTHAPQACLSANSSTSASRQYYNRVAFLVKQNVRTFLVFKKTGINPLILQAIQTHSHHILIRSKGKVRHARKIRLQRTAFKSVTKTQPWQ